MVIRGWRLYGPMAFFFVYLTATIFLFEFGPWPWPISNKPTLYGYLAFAHVAVALGYILYARSAPLASKQKAKCPRRLITYSIWANALFVLPTSLARTGSLIPDFAGGLQDLGAVYEIATEKGFAGNAGVWIEYCRVAFAPLLAAFLPLSLFFWRELKVRERIMTVGILGGYAATSLASGVNKGMVDLALLVPWIIYAAVSAGMLSLDRKRRLVLLILVVVFSVAALFIFRDTQVARTGSGAEGGYFGPPLNIRSTTKLGSEGFLSDDSIILIESLSRYVCSGYVALAWALEKDFTSTFGLGHSMFIARNAQALGFASAIENSYPGKLELEDGWGYFRLFHSIHTWIASDVSFPGTLLVMFLIGRFFSQAWIDTLTNHSPLAVINLAHFVQMLFYFPANHQLAQSPEPFFAFYLLLIAWQVTRRRQRNTVKPLTKFAAP